MSGNSSVITALRYDRSVCLSLNHQIEDRAKYSFGIRARTSRFDSHDSRAHAHTYAILARARVKYRVVILGSLAKAWHCSREYRVERSRLPGASRHTNPSPRFISRSILALVYVRLSSSSSLFPLRHYLFSSNVTSSSLFPDTSHTVRSSSSLCSLFLFSASLFISALPDS